MTRLVLLGASNVRRAFPTITALAVKTGVRKIFGAFGQGRSYGKRSCIPFRCLPGILECGIWEALRSEHAAPTIAVITDIGNDLLYGSTVTAILGWISQCLLRLRNEETRIVVTELPIERIRRLDRVRFLFFRSLLFPGCRLSLERVIADAEELNDGLRRIAEGEGAAMFRPEAFWYAWDPIHIRRSRFREAWAEILGASAAASRATPGDTWRLLLAPPEHRWIFGIERWRSQPAVRAGGGLEIRLY